MTIGEHKLATQVGPCGFFAGVCFECECVSEFGLSITYGGKFLTRDTRWKAALEFGIQHAWGHVRLRNEKESSGLKVTVIRIDWHNDCDTTVLTVAYAAAHALYNALGLIGELSPHFDQSKKQFVFRYGER